MTGQGLRFLGQTGLLTLADGGYAWGGLWNPPESGVEFYLSSWTVTNFGAEPLLVEAWWNAALPGPGVRSRHVASADQSLRPLPEPKVELREADRRFESPKDGGFAALYVVEPHATFGAPDVEGTVIVPSGSNVSLFLRVPGKSTVRARASFAWSERNVR